MRADFHDESHDFQDGSKVWQPESASEHALHTAGEQHCASHCMRNLQPDLVEMSLSTALDFVASYTPKSACQIYIEF